MTIRRVSDDMQDDYTVAACPEHVVGALVTFTAGTVSRLGLLQYLTGEDTLCRCGRAAKFQVVHVTDEPALVPPTIPAERPVTSRPAHCVGTHDKRHRDVCVACGLTPGGRHGL